MNLSIRDSCITGYVTLRVPVRELRATSARLLHIQPPPNVVNLEFLSSDLNQRYSSLHTTPENVRTCIVYALFTTDIYDNTDYIDL